MNQAIETITVAVRCGHTTTVHRASSTFDFPEEATCDEPTCSAGEVGLITEDDMGLWVLGEFGDLISTIPGVS